MKPVLEYLPRPSGNSFVVKYFEYPYFPTPWHFHPEYEIVMVTESQGKRFVGNVTDDFGPGDISLLGPSLPHLYRNPENYYAASSRLKASSIVIHFKKESFGEGFTELPEASLIKNLLERSMAGIDVLGPVRARAAIMIEQIVGSQGLDRMLKLMELLHTLAESKDLKTICTEKNIGTNSADSSRMNRILDFVHSNFHQEVCVAQVAEMVNMSENAFSRYFSLRTRQSFTGFLNAVRLNHASTQLAGSELSVLQVSLDCGFSNLSNFNRQFKRLYKRSPLQYRKYCQDLLHNA